MNQGQATDRRNRAARPLAAAVELGDNATAVACDISKVTDLDRLYAGLGDTGRKIDILVANFADYRSGRLSATNFAALVASLGRNAIRCWLSSWAVPSLM